MRSLTKAVALAAACTALMSAPVALAGDNMDHVYFQKMYDTNKDGMVTKEEAMKAVEKMFEKHDTKKKGMLDKKQFEIFLQDLMKSPG